MKQSEAVGLFALAGIPVSKMWRLPNGYITSSEDEEDADILREAIYRHRRPWWLAKTAAGVIEIGWRKRVISIDWEDTPIRAIITEDDVTKGRSYVHAWSNEKALEYLTALAVLLRSGEKTE